jgi:hypothetical protein
MSGIFSLISLLLLSVTASGQVYLLQDSIPVRYNGEKLRAAWAGGLNSAQLCGADLNNNGIEDIFVYDKIGKRKLAFIHSGIPGEASYSLDRSYPSNFPDIEGWVLLEDYNCDGIKDLFTYNNAGSIRVYKGYYDVNDRLAFTPDFDGLTYPSGAFNINLYNTQVDRPALVDVNGDGDLDIISMNVDGTRIAYYENRRIEDGLPCDSLRFVLADRCWGNIYESGLDAFVEIRDTCQGKFLRMGFPQGEEQVQHIGATMTALDADGDGDIDLVMGDVSFSFINLLTNDGTPGYASILRQDTLFPASKPLRLNSFPAASLLDVNNDGIKDLVFAPFESAFADNIRNLRLYYGTISGDWQYIQDDFLVYKMINVGEGAGPVFYDWNSDGRMDILIGNGGARYTPENSAPQTTDGITLLQNTSEPGGTSFELVDGYIFSTLTAGLKELALESGDINGNGLQDLLVGESTGRVYWIERLCAGSSTGCFVNRGPLKDQLNNDIDVGLNAVPALADLDRDGKPDLVIGERNGNLNYYRNVSAGGNIRFQLVTDSLGKIRVGLPNPVGHSAPDINDFDGDGKWDLLLGSFGDNLLFYSDIESHLAVAFPPPVPLITDHIGMRTIPNSADINGDGSPEIIVGNYSGGVQIYTTGLPLSNKIRLTGERFSMQLFPNPASSQVNIVPDRGMTGDRAVLTINDMLGRKWRSEIIYHTDGVIQVQLTGLPPGLYFIRMDATNGYAISTLVVQ